MLTNAASNEKPPSRYANLCNDGLVSSFLIGADHEVAFADLIARDAQCLGRVETIGKELFHLASTSTLRVYVNVPEQYSRSAKPGVGSYLTLNEFPGRQFRGTIVRNAEAIDPSSRTLLVEVDVKNPTGELLPGSYVSVHLKLPSKVAAVVIPSNTLLFRAEGLRVGIVRNGRTELVRIILGHDYGDQVEVISGLRSDDAVIVNPSDSLAPGEKVQVAAPKSSGDDD